MHQFAQTNIQLINQMRREGYSAEEIAPVIRAYEAAMRLFTGLYRASGKTFIAHVVGSSSILAAVHASPRIVAAGLLHAAYSAGDFGDGRRGVTDARREWLRSHAGLEVEELVAGYTALKWSDEALSGFSEHVESLPPMERDVLLMRLANELEEILDLGALYAGEGKRGRADGNVGDCLSRTAEKLGYPNLAHEIRDAFAEAAEADLPSVLRRSDGRNFSFLLAPQSYQRVVDAVARRIRTSESSGKPRTEP